MLKINNSSYNFDGVSEIGGDVAVTINGSVTAESLYINISAADIQAAKAAKADIATDVAEFIETILS